MQLFLGILLLVMAIFLVIAVLMQNGKSKRLSGSIAGGAETFFGKSKSRTIDAVLSKITTVVAILFVLTVIIVYVAFGSATDSYYLTEEELNSMIENGEIVLDTATENNLDVEDDAVENETVEDESVADETVTDEVADESVEDEVVADDEK